MSLLFSKLRFFSFMPCDSIAFPMRVMQPFDKRYFDIRGKRNVRRNATGKKGFKIGRIISISLTKQLSMEIRPRRRRGD